MSEFDQTSDTPVEEKSNVAEKKPETPLSSLLYYAEMITVCLAICLLTFSFFFRICTVSGESMLPTLSDGQLLFTSKLFYEPQTGDIVVFHQTSEDYPTFNEPIIKRVIATAGQTVQIDFTARTVSVDGSRLDENYIQLTDSFGIDCHKYYLFAEHDMTYRDVDGASHAVMELTVPEGKLFVMGDNRNHSSDSRTNVIGLVDERRLLGRVLFRISPFSRFGAVD